jgi:tRNA (cmo5U34)-methyltransferase
MIALRERAYRPGRVRVPEPMAMDEPESVAQFHAGGANVGAMLAVYDLSARMLNTLVPEGGKLLELGVGSGRALQRFLAMRPDVTATGVDLAPNMLATAHQCLDGQGMGRRVSLVEADLTALPADLTGETWDAVSCVWTLHHLPDRETLRAALRQIGQIRDSRGSAIWLLDLQRLRHPDTWPSLAAAMQPDLPPVLRTDGLASEAAAFTHEELRTELAACGLGDLASDLLRPIPFLQAFWCRRRSHDVAASSRAHPESLRRRAGIEAMLLRRGFSRLPI